MNLIIEGPDNAGKSTLIEFLKPHLVGSVIHNTVDKDAQSVLAKQSAELSRQGNTCYDRSAVISEYIYCSVLRRAPVIDINLDSIFRLAESTILVICLPAKHHVTGTTKEEMAGVKENISALYDAYDSLVDHLSIAKVPFVVYDWEANEPQEILDYINHRNEMEWKK